MGDLPCSSGQQEGAGWASDRQRACPSHIVGAPTPPTAAPVSGSDAVPAYGSWRMPRPPYVNAEGAPGGDRCRAFTPDYAGPARSRPWTNL